MAGCSARGGDHTAFVSLLIPCRVASNVLLLLLRSLLLLLATLIEHLLEELELRKR